MKRLDIPSLHASFMLICKLYKTNQVICTSTDSTPGLYQFTFKFYSVSEYSYYKLQILEELLTVRVIVNETDNNIRVTEFLNYQKGTESRTEKFSEDLQTTQNFVLSQFINLQDYKIYHKSEHLYR